MSKKPDYSYNNKDGKRVTGSAAFLHHVYSENGGIQEYNDSIGKEYIEEFIKYRSDKLQEDIEKKAKKNRFKII